MKIPLDVILAFLVAHDVKSSAASNCYNAQGNLGPCKPGREFCLKKGFKASPAFHLMDQHGCGENDPNGPIFDPVHGVIHHFYQVHLAAPPGHGPIYGHFVSNDFINWAQMPVAIWNGIDDSVVPNKITKYDNEAIFTGSAFVVNGAGPGGKGPGVVSLYPGLCNAKDWPNCKTGTLLAQAVPANYEKDQLLTNWTKPEYNPIVENTQRDPSGPWKTPYGEWRMRTFDSKVYASASDADVLAGKWHEVGVSADFRTCECPSLYPLPKSTPGFEKEYDNALTSGTNPLPTHVHKTSCSGDWWQMGTYTAGRPKEIDSFKPTKGWEDLFEQVRVDVGNFYASKDNIYPRKSGGERRINWGWAIVDPASAQTLPREITFNAATRSLQQYPIEELTALRKPSVYSKTEIVVNKDTVDLALPNGTAKQSEIVARFRLPETATRFGITIGGDVAANHTISCTVAYQPPNLTFLSEHGYYTVPVSCGGHQAPLRLLSHEKVLELRIFSDWTFIEAYFQQGRVAITAKQHMSDGTRIFVHGDGTVIADSVDVYPMLGIWTSAEAVRNAPRIYGTASDFRKSDIEIVT
eukprot:TRINITY_DN6994_c1_g1_i1.p1 TRINITY_DN6994_c1_g1~~TRINITY_DN6994_c1_g1_i1.p1  ORF type:complete len:579 (-),score=93.45 TRINITY_DN6994_c1_g1_i1:263-1999(-)